MTRTQHQLEVEGKIRRYCEDGDASRAATLAIETYGPELLRFISALIRDADSAPDVFSLVCEDLWRGLPGLRWNGSFRTWAYAVARQACYRHLRSPVHKRFVRLSDVDELNDLVASIRTRTQRYLRTDIKTRFNQLRASLSADDQCLLTLRVDRGLDWNELALALSDEPLLELELKRAAATYRKRFERLQARLHGLARDAGLLAEEEEP